MTYTENDIACCVTIRCRDLPQPAIEEAVRRVVAFANAGRMTPLGRRCPDICGAFTWLEESCFSHGGSDLWPRIEAAEFKNADPQNPRARRRL